MMQTAEATVEIQNPLVLVEDDVQEIETDAATALRHAQEFEVDCLRAYETAVDAVLRLRTQKASVMAFFEPMAKAANALHKQITGRRGEVAHPIDQAIKVLESKIGIYRAEQQRIAQEKERAERQRLEAEQRELRETEALAAAEANDELAFARAAKASEEPVPIPEVKTAPAVVEAVAPKVKGMRETTRWKARLSGDNPLDETAVRALCQAVADGSVPTAFIEPNWKALDQYAEASKGGAKVPGIEFYSETKTTISRAR